MSYAALQLTLRRPSALPHRRRLWKAAAIALIGLVILSGCADDGGSTVSRARLYGRYDVTEVQWGAGGGRDFTVVVRNNPTDLPDEDFERIVVESIQGQITYMITNFTTTPGESTRSQYRVEFFFEPPETTNAFALCNTSRDLPETVARPGETYVLAALCLRDVPMSEAFGRAGRAEPGSEEFNYVMSQVIRSILPQFQRGRNSRCPPGVICS